MLTKQALKKFPDSITAIPFAVAPKTFLIPISLVF
jgi:hypothetical protein